MAKMLVSVRLQAGGVGALREALSSDPRWTGAKFTQIFVDPAASDRALIWSGWNTPEEAEQLRGDVQRSVAAEAAGLELDGEPTVLINGEK